MVDIIHRIGIKAPLAKVFEAVSTVQGVAGWWTRETTGNSGLGGAIHVVFRTPTGEEKGQMDFELTKLEPHRQAQWRFTAGPSEWLGTDVTFDLTQNGEYTLIVFGHRGWREPVEFMAHCSMKWATFLLSLRQLVETGEGRPAPIDLKIDDWN
ncbi:MAG: SRPBCC domain-containing protein [Myxococcales bacterium]|nr:MAG: SRPBCC domain-containing protein [Myxococcales bacterium]